MAVLWVLSVGGFAQQFITEYQVPEVKFMLAAGSAGSEAATNIVVKKVLSVILARMRAGDTLAQAYYQALLFTGKVVMLTGITLAIAVATWAFSPIKFQADMGILLAFMFLVNMLGALILLPALTWLLLPQKVFAKKPETRRLAQLVKES